MVVELVELVVAEHGGVVSPRRMTHVDLPVAHHPHQRRALQHVPLRMRTPLLRHPAVARAEHVEKRLHVAIRVVHVHLLERHTVLLLTVRVKPGHHSTPREIPVRQTFHLLHHQTDISPISLLASWRVRCKSITERTRTDHLANKSNLLT